MTTKRNMLGDLMGISLITPPFNRHEKHTGKSDTAPGRGDFLGCGDPARYRDGEGGHELGYGGHPQGDETSGYGRGVAWGKGYSDLSGWGDESDPRGTRGNL